jgi:3',5'-cyclic AMP phosphodiesterase CpdA
MKTNVGPPFLRGEDYSWTETGAFGTLRLMFRLRVAVTCLLVFALFGCVSRTLFDLRFRESEGLTAPTLATPPADPDHFSFAIVGDLHIQKADTSRLQRVITAAGAEGDSFFIFLGDIVDQGKEEDVKAFRDTLTAASWDAKAFPVIGNHDIFEDGWTFWKKYNGPSHYTFTAGNSRFIVLDTADGALGDDQRRWLVSELEKPAPANTFLLSHYLPTVPGERTYLKLSDDAEALELMKLATNKGVRGWFGAHYHSYLKGNVGGVDYVVAGGGGGRRMKPVEECFYVQVTVSGTSVTYKEWPVE